MTSRPTSAEITARPFTKSSFSGGQGSCVGIKRFDAWTAVGKTQLGEHSPTLIFPNADWDRFCIHVAQEERVSVGKVNATFIADGGFILTETDNDQAPTIAYDQAEWEAFRLGVRTGELHGTEPHGVLVG